MRTTLTLDDHIAKALKERAHQTNRPFKDVVNETLRLGLSASAPRRRRRYRLEPAALGGLAAAVDLDKALALADAIEDQELARKMQLRK